jgi:thymidylate synthase (FAD)
MITHNKSSVTYKDHMGSDGRVVNAARVSFHKEIAEDTFNEKDEKLIAYLARHDHWSPFTHCQMTVIVKAPLFVARQLWKSHVGVSGGDAGYMAWNEVSRRYVDEPPEFYSRNDWRLRPEGGIKQGSSSETISLFKSGWPGLGGNIKQRVDDHYQEATELYDLMLKEGIAPELARMILPQSMFTEWYWTGSLLAFARICNQRLDNHAQKESQEVAIEIYNLLLQYFPISAKHLIKSVDIN